jgi:predicted AAA+ superfamily ATPase
VYKIPSLLHMCTDDVQYCRQWFDEYLLVGGLPESLFMASDVTRVKFLQNIAETVVFRDVV